MSVRAIARSPRRLRALFCVAASLLLCGAHDGAASGGGVRWLVAFEVPQTHVLYAMAEHEGVDVRWVEQDLVLAEVAAVDDVPRAWGGRVVARREPTHELALLHARRWETVQAHAPKAMRRLREAHVATVHARAGAVSVLLASPDAWPAELLGCHGEIVLPRHHVDPRSVLDEGPPPALEPWVRAPRRDWSPDERATLNAVNDDSLVAFFDLLTKNAIGLPADRYVFAPDLGDLYIPRVRAAMENAVAGVSLASVRLQTFEKTRSCPAGSDRVETANVIARIPGSTPGTGTFVVCAHLDATGSSDASWVQLARNECQPPSQTPGGEDNASGVATMLEVLRCVADGVRQGALDFAFDLEFVAFSGEEAEGSSTQPGGRNRFLTGSELYVQTYADSGVTLLGAFNLDMVGSEQLGNNMQLVHNPASAWLAQFAQEAASFVDPPLDLTFTAELDEALSSDHNSFWTENAAAILGADAPVDTLRSYATYHRPIDTGLDRDVRAAKMREVARAVVATLLRFDTQAHSEPALFVPVDAFRVSFLLNDDDQDATLFRLFPGDQATAALKLYNVGAQYDGPVRFELRKERADGTSVLVREEMRPRIIPTGGLVQFDAPMPIVEADGGQTRVVAHVSWTVSGGIEASATAAETLLVRGRHKPEIAFFRPNPVHSVEDAELLMELNQPGTVTVRLYNLEGEEVYSGTQRVRADSRIIRAGEEPVLTAVPLASTATRLVDLVSGAYFARVDFRGENGSSATSSARLVVVR